MSIPLGVNSNGATARVDVEFGIIASEFLLANLFDAVTNGRPVSIAISVATSTLKPLGAFKPVPTAVPPRASSSSPSLV